MDLLEGDALSQENKLLDQEVGSLKKIVAVQDSLRTFQSNQILDLQRIIELQQVQSQQNSIDYKSLEKEVRRQSTLKTVFATTTAVTVGALIVSLIFGGK